MTFLSYNQFKKIKKICYFFLALVLTAPMSINDQTVSPNINCRNNTPSNTQFKLEGVEQADVAHIYILIHRKLDDKGVNDNIRHVFTHFDYVLKYKGDNDLCNTENDEYIIQRLNVSHKLLQSRRKFYLLTKFNAVKNKLTVKKAYFNRNKALNYIRGKCESDKNVDVNYELICYSLLHHLPNQALKSIPSECCQGGVVLYNDNYHFLMFDSKSNIIKWPSQSFHEFKLAQRDYEYDRELERWESFKGYITIKKQNQEKDLRRMLQSLYPQNYKKILAFIDNVNFSDNHPHSHSYNPIMNL